VPADRWTGPRPAAIRPPVSPPLSKLVASVRAASGRSQHLALEFIDPLRDLKALQRDTAPLAVSGNSAGGKTPPPPKPTTQVGVVADQAHLDLRWLNVLRVEAVIKPELVSVGSKVPPLVLDPAKKPLRLRAVERSGEYPPWKIVSAPLWRGGQCLPHPAHHYIAKENSV